MEVEAMQAIFKRIAPKTIWPIQTYYSGINIRTNATYGVEVSKRKYNMIFQYFDGLSPARRKILDKIKGKVAYTMYWVEMEKGIICMGWKYEK